MSAVDEAVETRRGFRAHFAKRPAAPLVAGTCQQCGQSFKRRAAAMASQRFCSRACARVFQHRVQNAPETPQEGASRTEAAGHGG